MGALSKAAEAFYEPVQLAAYSSDEGIQTQYVSDDEKHPLDHFRNRDSSNFHTTALQQSKGLLLKA